MAHIISITKKYVSDNGYFVELDRTLPATLPLAEENQIKAVVAQTLQVLNINDGGGHTEVKVTANGVKVIGVGARLGGDHIPELVAMATGIDMWKAVIQVTLDIQPDVTPKTHKFASISYLTNPPGIVKNIIYYPKSNA